MNMKNTMFSLPALAIVLSSGNAFGQNLLANGDFEDTTGLIPSTSAVEGWVAVSPDWVTGWSSSVAESELALWNSSSIDDLFNLYPSMTSVQDFEDSALSSGWYNGFLATDINTAHPDRCITQSVSGLTGDHEFSGVFAVSDIIGTPMPSGVVAEVSYTTYLNGIQVNSVSVESIFGGGNPAIEFAAPINQAAGAFDAITVQYCFESDPNFSGSSLVLVDGFSLTAVVPEPSSAILLGLGSLGLFLRRKRTEG